MATSRTTTRRSLEPEVNQITLSHQPFKLNNLYCYIAADNMSKLLDEYKECQTVEFCSNCLAYHSITVTKKKSSALERYDVSRTITQGTVLSDN